jgi:hypothetical protein
MPNVFKLQKLTIKAYPTAARKEITNVATFTVPFNPSSFQLSYASKYSQPDGLNPVGPTPKFIYSKPEGLEVELLFDGTGAVDYGVEHLPGLGRIPGVPTGSAPVAATIQKFLDACYSVTSATHEPNYLTINWGKGPLGTFPCRLSKADVSYTAFGRDGSPLRAMVSAVFLADLPVPKKRRKAALTSPDLSHSRTVRAGDSVPLLCQEVYGSPRQHAAVARANDLDSLRSVPVGKSLIFPPLEA